MYTHKFIYMILYVILDDNTTLRRDFKTTPGASIIATRASFSKRKEPAGNGGGGGATTVDGMVNTVQR